MAYLYSNYLIPKFEEYLHSGLILDVGCGKGGLEAIVKTVPEKDFNCEFVGVDASLEMLSVAKSFVDHVVCASADHLPFKDKAFDAVFSIEVIEHLPKDKGYSLIQEIERVSRGLVAITTPSHFFSLDSSSTGFDSFMEHYSFWRASEFKRKGYLVEGIQPARDYIPRFLSKRIPYLANTTIFYKKT
jgi:ubiquinone/menaquinone biosynthesis C-methylase UbiE